MNRRLLPLLALLAALAAATPSFAESTLPSGGNPNNDQGSYYQYSSIVTGVTPHVAGLIISVQEFADRLLLTNHTGQTVTIYGYQGEPYARVLADGTAEQNEHSPATYLNTTFYGNVTVPPQASAGSTPKWIVVDRTGTFEWHDHRIHWNSPLLPPEVRDRGKRTVIFAWSVPISVGAQKGAIAGVLYWNPESSKASTAVIVIGVVIVLAGLLFVLYVRRRRSGGSPPRERSRGPAEPAGEAW